jgi:hypothetical protein
MLKNTGQTRTGYKRQARADSGVNGHPYDGKERNHNEPSTHTQQTGQKSCRPSHHKTFRKEHNHGSRV